MNQSAAIRVGRGRWRKVALWIQVTLGSAALAGCVDVNGGAVELSWTIQDTRGDRRNCDDGPLGVVRLRGTGEGGEAWVSDDARCDANRLASRFQIVPGRWAFALDVRCAAGQAANVQVPDPISRDIVRGQVAQLNALLIVIKPGRASCLVAPDAAILLDAPPAVDGAPDGGADALTVDASDPDSTPIDRRSLPLDR